MTEEALQEVEQDNMVTREKEPFKYTEYFNENLEHF